MLSLQHHILPSSYPENANESNTCGPLKIRFRSTTEAVVFLASTIIINGHRYSGNEKSNTTCSGSSSRY